MSAMRATTLFSLQTRSLARTAAPIARPRPTPAFKATPRLAHPNVSRLGGVRAMASTGSLKDEVLKTIRDNKLVVYSKTYCPYCSEVKSLFASLDAPAKVLELDQLPEGGALQAAVAEVCGRSTVPQVFVGGKHLGGCDDTLAAKTSGKLKAMLEEAGVSTKL